MQLLTLVEVVKSSGEYLPLDAVENISADSLIKAEMVTKKRISKKVDAILVNTETTNRKQWPLEMIEDCQADADNLVQTINVPKTNGVSSRDIRKLCLLEFTD